MDTAIAEQWTIMVKLVFHRSNNDISVRVIRMG